MKEFSWIDGMHHRDTRRPFEEWRNERMHTLYLRDFLRMPDVDFVQLATLDPALRSLMN